MSLALVRRSSRALAACLVLVWLWGLPHRSDADDVCAPAGTERHDESKHVFTSGAGHADEDHCAVCHWLRTLKPGLDDSAATSSDRTRDGELVAVRPSDLRDPACERLSARAPPSPVL